MTQLSRGMHRDDRRSMSGAEQLVRGRPSYTGSTGSTYRGRHGDKPTSPGASSTDTEVMLGDNYEAPVAKVPGIALPMQHSLLKRISAFRSKEELLEFVAAYHMLLDSINLVTCLYRLAKMSKESARGRVAFVAELQKSPTFQLLLRSISAQFLRGHLSFLHTHTDGMKGVDSRCLANLVWALAKLDLSDDEHGGLTTDLALTVAPFIIRSVSSSSPQGLANMLWSYAKLPVAPADVVVALMNQITKELLQAAHNEHHKPFDAQALSNSIWALAHMKSRGMDLEALPGANLLAFLEALAGAAARMLLRISAANAGQAPSDVGDCVRLLATWERDFSCQALVNIAWSYATLAGGVCATHPPIRHLFALIHSDSLIRLACTSAVLRAQQAPHSSMGGFNEQALSNAVYAFDKASLLTSELLSRVFEVSVLRLQRGRHDAAISFKPQELCTLLKACHSNIAPPWKFLATLLLAVDAAPHLVDTWGPAERMELHRARLLFNNYQAEQVAASRAAASNAALLSALGGLQQQQQQQQQHAAALAAAQQQAAANAQLGNLAALGAGGMGGLGVGGAGVSGAMRSLPPLSSQQLGSLSLPLGNYGLTSPAQGAPGGMAASMGMPFLPPAMSMAMAMAAAQHRRPSGTGGQVGGAPLQQQGLQGGAAPGGTPLGPW